jgi:hypothetical protein
MERNMSKTLTGEPGPRRGRLRLTRSKLEESIGSCGVAALQRMSSLMTAKNTTHTEEERLPAPLVYRDEADQSRWIVDPPVEQPAEPTAFTGPNACQAALEFAHRTYGCARYLSSADA